MKRTHLFELEDQNWFPKKLRIYGTDFLRFLTVKTKMFHPIIPVIKKGIEHSRDKQIVDLCSGSGGGIIELFQELKKDHAHLKIVFTDLFPNLTAKKEIESKLTEAIYHENSIDARNVSAELKGLRTMFLSFHHFNEKEAKKILQNVVDCEESIAIFEGQERSFKSVIAMFFSPISVLLITPFIRPFSLWRLVFTYLIPIVPIFVWWDGIVSSMRTYSVNELNNLVKTLHNGNKYKWEINRIKSGPVHIIYLLGLRK